MNLNNTKFIEMSKLADKIEKLVAEDDASGKTYSINDEEIATLGIKLAKLLKSIKT